MPNNQTLQKARASKKDEFYTQYQDIENELKNYDNAFNNKTVYCNCDNPEYSNFWKYFIDNFEKLKLKKVVSTFYNSNSCAKYTEALMIDDKIRITEKELKQNGDFRNSECIEILKNSDIVVTNPPFSLFREYMSQLIKYKKDFVIIGHQNAITYKEVFPYIKDNTVWLGYGFKGLAGHFISPEYKDYATASKHREGMIRVSGVIWLTNLKIDKQIPFINLIKQYNSEEYPKYDEYDAINVNKTKEIPVDYNGAMGVPISFIHKYNSEQFKIIELLAPKYRKVRGKGVYARIIINKI